MSEPVELVRGARIFCLGSDYMYHPKSEVLKNNLLVVCKDGRLEPGTKLYAGNTEKEA